MRFALINDNRVEAQPQLKGSNGEWTSRVQ